MWWSKKSIAIFGYKQWLLSLDMKTKVVQHVPRIIFNINKIWLDSKKRRKGKWIHSHTLSLSHYLTLSMSHSHTLTLSFTHSPHAEQLLFSCLGSKVTDYRWKWQWIFFDSNITLSCDFWVHWAGSQLKMSESQTKAGNQKKFDPRDMLNNFCFHV